MEGSERPQGKSREWRDKKKDKKVAGCVNTEHWLHN